MTSVVAIDIGMSGAMACIDVARRAYVVDLQVIDELGDRSIDGAAIYAQLLAWVPVGMPCLFVAENVRARAQGNGGRALNSMQSQGQMMRTRGAVEAVVRIARHNGMDIREVWVNPPAWKRAFGLKRDEGDTDSQVKEKSRQCAIRLFPGFADTALKFKNSHNRSEALLLAHWGRAMHL